MIHVCFALHDETGRYSKFTGTTITSIFENLSPGRSTSVTIHILHNDTLSRSNRDNLAYIAGCYNQFIEFHNVEKLYPEKIQIIKDSLHAFFKNRFSVAAMYRFLIPELFLGVTNKAIYLDSDIIVNLDINDFWRVNLDDKPIGAIPNVFQAEDKAEIIKFAKKSFSICKDKIVNAKDYFNSGVLLMNLKVLLDREKQIMSAIKFIGEHPRYSLVDQDVLNYCFSKDYLRLPVTFNQYVKYARPNKERVGKKIYHYAGGKDGLGMDLKDPFNRLWMHYFSKTPWFDSAIIGNLYDGIERFGEARKKLLVQFSLALLGKTRVFVVKDNADWLKENYFIRDDEEIFIYEDETSLQKLIDYMKATCDKKLFLIKAREIISPLKDAGFVEGKDFFNHYVLFSPSLLSHRDIYSLILGM